MTMRRQSLRPRQIDIHARMRIIRSQEDLVIDDDAAGAQPSTTTFEELVAVRFSIGREGRSFLLISFSR
jgi:hypothetical protein